MRKIFSEIKKYSIILIIICAVLGSLLIAFPAKMVAYVSLFIGGAFIACGVFAIINYIIRRNYVLTLTLGIISAVSGLVICLAYRQIISVIVFLMGIFLLVGGIFNLVNAITLVSALPRGWLVNTALSVISIILGIVSMTDPFKTQDTLVQFLGFGLIVFAVLDLIAYIQIAELARKLKKSAKTDSAIEVDYTEIDSEK